MKVNFNSAQQPKFIQNNNQKQNRQQVSFGAINLAKLQETIGESVFEELLNTLKEMAIVGKIGKSIEQINKILFNNPHELEIFDNVKETFNGILKENGFNFSHVSFSKEKKQFEIVHPENNIPSAADILIYNENKDFKSEHCGTNTRERHMFYLTVARITNAAEENLHNKLIAENPDVKNKFIVEGLDPQKTPYFVMQGNETKTIESYQLDRMYGEEYQWETTGHLKYYDMPKDDEVNKLLYSLDKAQRNIKKITTDVLISLFDKTAEIKRNLAQVEAEPARIEAQEQAAKGVKESINSFANPKK